MTSEELKKRLDTIKTPENSQTIQSGYSASSPELSALGEELRQNRAQARATEQTEWADSRAIATGKARYEADKQAYKKQQYANTYGAPKDYAPLPQGRAGWQGSRDDYIDGMDEATLNQFYKMYGEMPEGVSTTSDEYVFNKALDWAQEWQKTKAQVEAAEKSQKRQETVRDIAEFMESTLLGSILNIETPEVKEQNIKAQEDYIKTLAAVAGIFGTPIDAASALVDYAAGGGRFSEQYKAGNKTPFTTASSQSQSEVISDIEQAVPQLSTKAEGVLNKYLGIQNWAALGYEAGVSALQSLLTFGAGGAVGAAEAGLALFGTSGFVSTLNEKLNEGVSDDQALSLAVIGGALEVVTEEVSLESVLKAREGGNLATRIANVLKASFAEMSEEAASDIGNYVADAVIRMDESEFAVAKAYYMGKGESPTEASIHAILEHAPELAYSGISGFLSGAMMSGVGSGVRNISESAQARKTVSDYQSSGTANELYDIINASDAREGKAPVGETTSHKDLIKAYREAMRGAEVGAIQSRLEGYGLSAEQSRAMAEAIYHEGNDYVTTLAERKALQSNEAQVVLDEYQKALKGVQAEDTEWLGNVRAFQHNVAKPKEAQVTSVGIEAEREEIKERAQDEQRTEAVRAAIAAQEEEERSFRRETIKGLADEAGIDVESVISQHTDLSTERYAKALETAYRYGETGISLEKVASVTGLSTQGAISDFYDAGLKKRTEDRRVPTKRIETSGKVHFATSAELKKYNTKKGMSFTPVNVEALKKDKPKWAAVQFLAKFVAPRIHRKIVFFDGGKSTNGWRTSDSIFINVNGKMTGGKEGDVLGIFMHEFGHDLRADSPEMFDELEQIVINEAYNGDTERFDRAVQQRIASRYATVEATGEGKTIDTAQAAEEIVCDSLSKIAGDEEALKRLFVGHKNLLQKMLDFFKKILDDLRAFIKTYGGDNDYSYFVDASAMEKMVGVLERYVTQIDESAPESSAKGIKAEGEAITAETSSDAQKVSELAKSGIEYDPSTETAMFSARDIPKNEEEVRLAIDRLVTNLGISEAEASQWVNSELSAASLILDPKFSAVLDYEGDRRYTAVKKNSDYPQGTLDFSNICRKRRQYTALMQNLQKQFPNRVFTASELAEAREILIEEGLDVACGLCYVEDRRQKEGEIAQGFQEAMKRWLAGDRTGFNKQQTKALENLKKGDSIPTIYDLTTLEGMNGLRKSAPNVALAWEKFNNARGMQSARLLQGEAEYKRQILKYKKAQVKRINDLGGLRIYSFSDFEEFHLLDIIQAVQDCAAMGLKIQFYTKVPSFAKLMMNTGAKGNRSLIPLGALGYHMDGDKVVLDYDTREGININDPDFFDSIDHPNIGNVLVGINNEQIGAAFLDPFVDYIIPFHTGQSKEILKIKKIDGWVNYKDFQEDKPLQPGNRTKPINIYTEVLQAAEQEGNPITNERQFVEKFLEVCRKEGMRPRFWQFLNVDENGNYTYRKGYYKLLLDFKLFDKNGNILPQQAVTGQFDDTYIEQILTNYATQKLDEQKKLQPKLDKAYTRINSEIIGEEAQLSQNEDAAPTFYSQMGKVIEQSKANKFDARSLINMLLGKGVKAEEIKWSGISAWLDGRKSVTKQELLEFIRGSMLQIDEEWLRTEEDRGEISSAEWEKAYQHTYDAAVEIIEDMWRFKELKDKETAIDSIEIDEDYDGTIFTVQTVIDGEEKTILKYNMRERKTRWERYVLPGESDTLSNYRELLFIMPGSDYTNDAMRIHWERPGVLAHARIEDRRDYPNAPVRPLTGEVAPMLFIEEIQSDWHNAGAKEGYLGQTEGQIGIKKLRKFRESGIPALRAAAQGLSPDEFVGMVNAAARDAGLNWNASISDDFFELQDDQGEIVAISPVVNSSAFLNSIGFKLGLRINEYGKGKAPDAPFKNGKYVEYVLKRLIRLAAEQGYAQIGWTAAEQQIFRWSPDYAEGYRIEYDQDIPKFLNKFGKQWGAKVSQTTLTSEDAETVWTFPITDAMRESVVSEGLPLYSMNEQTSQSIRDIDEVDLTPREYLAAATLETIKNESDKAELRKILDEYRTIEERKEATWTRIKELTATKHNLESDIDAINKALKDTKARKSKKVTELLKRYDTLNEALKGVNAELADVQKELNQLRAQQGKDTQRLHEILTMPRVESVIEAQRKLVREYRELVDSTKAADKAKLDALRARMSDKLRAEIDRRIETRKQMMERYKLRQAQRYYLPRIQKLIGDLSTNVNKAPVPFRGPVYKFLSLLDMRTRDKDGNVREGQANIDRETFRQTAEALLGTGEGSIADWLSRYGIVLSDDVVTWIEDSRNYLEWMVLNQTETDIRTATADQLKSLYQFARSLDQTLRKFSKSYTNANLDMTATAQEAIDYVASNWGKRANDRVKLGEKELRWRNAQPETVFDRLGSAGQEIFGLLAEGEAKKAFNEQTIADFTKTWDKKSVEKWMNSGTIDVEFTSGKEKITVPMTPLQMMDLYCTAQDPDGLQHLLVGGFRLDRIVHRHKFTTSYETDETRHITDVNIQELIDAMNAYDDKLIPFADSLQDFVDTVGSRWGNQVSIRRFGYEQFTEEHYWPLVTVKSLERQDVTKMGKEELPNHIFDLVNKSFTKERIATADNAIVVKSIFDVFFDHMENMALYNAYALPVLDTARFLRYQTYDANGHPTYVMDNALNDAFGTNTMQRYIERLIVDINGDKSMTAEDSFLLTGLRLRNRVAVAYNLRVVIQQPLSIFRAFDIIDPKYVTAYKNVKGTIAEMTEHSGIALKKSQGYYGADVKRSLMEKAIGTGPDLKNKVYDVTSKVSEIGMWGAEGADTITWATLWNACKNWVKDTAPSLTGDEFWKEVDARFSDIIYRTQVVDSVLQKSELMREKTVMARFLSSFKGEPTTTYNMLLRQYDQLLEARQSGRKISGTEVKRMLRTFATWGVQAAMLALVTSLADAWRDDDDYETWLEKFKEAMFGEYSVKMSFIDRLKEFSKSNVFDAYNFLELPLISDVLSLLQGYTPDRVDLMAVQQLINTANGIAKMFNNPSAKDVYKLLGSFSVISGLPFQNVTREVLALWNNTMGRLYPDLKIQTSPESASSGYEALYVAMKNGQSTKALALVDEIMGNVGDVKKAYAGVTSQIREAYRRGDITEDDAYEYMAAIRDYFGYSPNTDIRKQIAGWKD